MATPPFSIPARQIKLYPETLVAFFLSDHDSVESYFVFITFIQTSQITEEKYSHISFAETSC